MFRLIANVPGADDACDDCCEEELVDGIDMDSEVFKFLTCDGTPLEVDAMALSKSNCVREFDTSALGGALVLGTGAAFDFGDGAEQIGMEGSASWLI